MLITSMIVKVTPSKAMEVSRLLGHIPQLAVYGVHKGENIIVVAETATANEVENLFRQINSRSVDVLEICQSNITTASETRQSNILIVEKAKPAANEKFVPVESRRLQPRRETSRPLFDARRFAHA